MLPSQSVHHFGLHNNYLSYSGAVQLATEFIRSFLYHDFKKSLILNSYYLGDEIWCRDRSIHEVISLTGTSDGYSVGRS